MENPRFSTTRRGAIGIPALLSHKARNFSGINPQAAE